jgi:hypothetical protein
MLSARSESSLRSAIRGIIQTSWIARPYFHATIVSDEDVVGFEIAMDDPLFVRGCESVCDLQCVINSGAIQTLVAP